MADFDLKTITPGLTPALTNYVFGADDQSAASPNLWLLSAIKTLFAQSPSLVTPALGVATATSLAIGGATIGTNALAVTGTSAFSASVRIASAGDLTAYVSGSSGNRFALIGNVGSGILGLAISTGGMVGFTPTADATSPDAMLTRNAAGVIQFGTTAANAAGAWLAAKGTLTGGTLADQAQVLAITATQPATITAQQNAIAFSITSAGSSAQQNRGLVAYYLPGYTGSSYTAALVGDNTALSTGSVLVEAAEANLPTGNIGVIGRSLGSTSGLNAGFAVSVGNGGINVAVHGSAQVAKNSAKNIGVLGTAINTGSSPVQIGGFFSLNQTTVPTVSAALIADNGAQTDAIFLARDNGTTVFTIANGGLVTMTSSFVATTGILNTLASDAGQTDVTVCADNSTGQLYKGSGTIGICLGTSSARYKDQIREDTDGLAELVKLQPKKFRYIKGFGDDGAREQVGFLAEDVVNVLPGLVGPDALGRPNSVDIVGMIPAIIRAIQELKADNSDKEKMLAIAVQAIQEQQVQIEELRAMAA